MATILLIDDDEMMRHAITMALSTRGHVTVVAEDGIAGLDTFANAVFDLVITDIVMPWMEGLEIVVQSASAMPTSRSSPSAAGVRISA